MERTAPLADPANLQDRLNGRTHLLLSLVLGLAAACIVVVFFAPRFIYWSTLDTGRYSVAPEINRALVTLTQLRDPFVQIDHPSSRVIAWRLLFPVVGHYLSLPGWAFLMIPYLGCLLVLSFVAHLVLKETNRRLLALTAATLVGTTSWFFVSTGWLAYFDSWYILGALLIAFARPRPVLSATALLVPWIDERFILTLPLALIARAIYFNQLDTGKRTEFWADSVVVLSSILPYLGLRLMAFLGGSDVGSSVYVVERTAELTSHWMQRLWGAWEGLRVNWLFVGLFVWFAMSGRQCGWNFIIVVVTLITAIGTSVIAHDFSRSASMLTPAVVGGLILTIRRVPDRAIRMLPVLLAANLLLPASHVIRSFDVPIFYLRHGLYFYLNPPLAFRIAVNLERAKELLRRGDRRGAKSLLDKVIDFNPQHVQALVVRAQILHDWNDTKGAIRDLHAALKATHDESYRRTLRTILSGLEEPKSLETPETVKP